MAKEITREELKAIIKAHNIAKKKQEDYIKKMSKTEFGRQMLRQRGIKPLDD